MPETDFLLTSLIVVLMPGAGVIYTISTGLLLGWRASAVAALGCTLGIVPHLLASILGLAAILHVSAIAFQILKLIGVAYLLFLAWSMWKSSGTIRIECENNNLSVCGIAVRGFLINIFNPKLSLFFLAFLLQFVAPERGAPVLTMIFLGGVFMGMTLLVFIVYGFIANAARACIVQSPGFVRMTQRAFAIVFALLGAKLAMAER